ncbi:MAG: hypothetical protein JOZ32_10895 [Bryobacterales bacterium]|nr:hypothetical protein [Bryobacterales bacterium]
MKILGFLLLLCGWIIVLAAIALLPSQLSQISFVLMALGVEVLGLVFVFRAHLISGRDGR